MFRGKILGQSKASAAHPQGTFVLSVLVTNDVHPSPGEFVEFTYFDPSNEVRQPGPVHVDFYLTLEEAEAMLDVWNPATDHYVRVLPCSYRRAGHKLREAIIKP